jgi:hypothetical protein
MTLPDKALKLLRLALCDGVHEGEQTNASLSFIRELKKAGITAEMFMGPPVPKGFTRVKREDASPASPVSSMAQSDQNSIHASPMPSPDPKNNPYGAYEGEQLQWIYENRHRLSKRARAAVEQEMEARGLL